MYRFKCDNLKYTRIFMTSGNKILKVKYIKLLAVNILLCSFLITFFSIWTGCSQSEEKKIDVEKEYDKFNINDFKSVHHFAVISKSFKYEDYLRLLNLVIKRDNRKEYFPVSALITKNLKYKPDTLILLLKDINLSKESGRGAIIAIILNTLRSSTFENYKNINKTVSINDIISLLTGHFDNELELPFPHGGTIKVSELVKGELSLIIYQKFNDLHFFTNNYSKKEFIDYWNKHNIDIKQDNYLRN